MKDILIIVVGAILFVIVALLTLAAVTMLLWNWLMPTIFSLPEITILQAFGVNVLTGILFKSNIKQLMLNDKLRKRI